jgi:NitT/TauT family transport system substrate-binding protein
MFIRTAGFTGLAAVAMLSLCPAGAVSAKDLTLAVSHADAWDTSMPALAEERGLFKEAGLDVEILYTAGTSETVQAVISGSADIGVAVGLLGLFSAYIKDAPIRVIAPEWTGASDMFWYARSDSGIASLKDADGKTMGFSRAGSSTNLVALALTSQYGVRPELVPTGSISATLTQVMSGQIDIGYSLAPSVLPQVESGEVTVVARGSDSPELASQTTRVLIANSGAVDTKSDLIARFLDAYDKAIDAAYADSRAQEAFAEKLQLDPELVKKAIAEFYPRGALQTDEIKGLERSMADAVTYEYIEAPLTQEQIRELFPRLGEDQ